MGQGQDHNVCLSCGKCQKPRGKFMKTLLFFFGERLKFCEKFAIFLCKDIFLCKSLALASHISIPDLGRVCPRMVDPWPRIFGSPWAWPRALCPRLHLRCLVKFNFSGR